MQKLQIVAIVVCIAAVTFVEGNRRPNPGGRFPKRPRFEVAEMKDECTPEKARQDGCQCTPTRGNWACEECNKCFCAGGSWVCHLMSCIPLPSTKCWKPLTYFDRRQNRRRSFCGRADC